MDYIYEYKKSIPNILCNEIIKMFETEENKCNGIIKHRLNIRNDDNAKYFIIPKNNERWKQIEQFLYKELISKLKNYLINKNNYNIFENKQLYTPHFIIEKYENKYNYDTMNDYYITNNNARVITFIWHLNTVSEMENISFNEKYTISSEEGKLILFPCVWCCPYKHEIPISYDKYIITGWIYMKSDK